MIHTKVIIIAATLNTISISILLSYGLTDCDRSFRAGYDVVADTPGTGMAPAIAIAPRVRLGIARW
jgi:hypothetical protein